MQVTWIFTTCESLVSHPQKPIDTLPADTHLSFVCLGHQRPSHKLASQLDEILQVVEGLLKTFLFSQSSDEEGFNSRVISPFSPGKSFFKQPRSEHECCAIKVRRGRLSE